MTTNYEYIFLFRCHPGDKFRPVFDWAHFLVGFTAMALSTIAIYFTTEESFTAFKIHESAKWISVAYFCFFGLWHLITSSHVWWLMVFSKKEKTKPKDGEFLDAYGNSVGKNNDDDKKVESEDERDIFVFCSMILYFIIAFGLTVAMVTVIAIS